MLKRSLLDEKIVYKSFYGVPLTFSYFKEKFCVSHASASPLQDFYCLKCSEDLVEKIISPVIFDTNSSFKW